jgi:hypothetical protein
VLQRIPSLCGRKELESNEKNGAEDFVDPGSSSPDFVLKELENIQDLYP